MAFRRSGSEPELFDSFLVSIPKNETLEQVSELVDWGRLRELLGQAYSDGSKGGQPGYDPVLMLKLLLLEQWYRLSDVEVVREACDRLSFRAFLGIGSAGRVPDDSSLVRFRDRLREGKLLEKAMEEIAVQMEEKGLGIREGSIRIVDATLIPAATRPPGKGTPPEERLEPEADFTVKNGKPHYGWKLHLGQDRETGLIVGQALTPASVHDSQVFEELLDGAPAQVLADKGYDSQELRRACRAKGIKARLMKRAKPGKPLANRTKGYNAAIARTRSFIEGANATLKNVYRMGRAVCRGLEKTWEQAITAVLAFNLRRWSTLHKHRCAQ